MAGRSRIKGLEPELKRLIDKLIRDDRIAQAEIRAKLNELLLERGQEPLSESSLQRYAARMRKAGERMRQAQAMAATWAGELGDKPETELGRLTLQLVRTIAFDTSSALLQNPEPASPRVVKDICRAVRDYELAAKVSAEREIAIRKETAKEAAKAAKGAALRAGLSPEAVAKIEREVLGIVP